MRMDEKSRFREGVVLRPKRPNPSDHIRSSHTEAMAGSMVDVGLRHPIRIDRKLPPNIRVTVEIDPKKSRKSKIRGHVVRPATPRTECGIYWGYDVRLATSLSEVWTGCPYTDTRGSSSGTSNSSSGSGSGATAAPVGGYDLVIGTSENGMVPGSPEALAAAEEVGGGSKGGVVALKPFRHLLIVFGGLSGLESVVDADEQLNVSKEDTSSLFDMYLNTCPSQGSRTIRTEEALLITMSLLTPSIQANKPPE